MSVFRFFATLCALLALGLGAPVHAAEDFLDPADAFKLSVRALDDTHVELSYQIAKGYYLYRERFKFATDAAGVALGEAAIPAGLVKYDTALEQKVEIYHDQVVVVLPVKAGTARFQMVATHQGCAEKGLCYPPQPRRLDVQLKGFGAAANAVAVLAEEGANAATQSTPATAGSTADSLKASVLTGAVVPAVETAGTGAAVSTPAGEGNDESRLSATLRQGRLIVIIPVFLLAGLLLSLTPCVLPMVPILSAIIVGQGSQTTRARGFLLALTYALGMALLYTALGVAAGLLGEGLAGWLQKPAVLATFAALLVVLSLSMFGLYELQLPQGIRDSLSSKNDGLSGGQFAGVFAMGGLSALVVSPCVAAPLAGALLYISQTHDAFLGGVALFMLAAGMSVPLLVVGASAGHLLPRSGAWMEQVKHVFGLLLLGVAIYIVQPVLPAVVAMALWGSLLLVGAASLRAFEPVHPGPHTGVGRVVKGVGMVLALLGAFQFVGAASGGRNPLQPLAHLASLAQAGTGTGRAAGAESTLAFQRVASVAELDRALGAAGRPVMLDFYADWCVSCKEMEAQTFTDPQVHARLSKALLLRADVTANTADDRELLKRFHLFGPPGLIFFDAQGHERDSVRVVGYQDSDKFLASLGSAGL